MGIKTKLSAMMFVEWFIWGAWFVPLWAYLNSLGFSPSEIAWSYSSTAIAAIVAPIFVGVIADRYFSAQKVLTVLHLIGAALMFYLSKLTSFETFFPVLVVYACAYMPTIALTNSIAFSNVEDSEKDFPKIRVLGTIGWIFSGVVVGFLPSLMGFEDISATAIPLQITAIASLALAAYSLFLPDTPAKKDTKTSIADILGLNAIGLLKDRSFAVFALCSFLIAAPMAFYYQFTVGYLTQVGMPAATGWMTLGQFSEIFAMLLLPFFLQRWGIKKVLLIGLLATGLRYVMFMFGGTDSLLPYALLFGGLLLHGISYDFYYVTGYIYVDKKTPAHMRTAAQGLITLICQGMGSLLGNWIGGQTMEAMTLAEPVGNITFNWSAIWGIATAMVVMITVLFLILFNEKSKEIKPVELQSSAATPTPA